MFFFSFYPDTFCAPLLGACVKIQENKIKWCCLLAFCFCTHVSSDCGLTLRCAVRFSLTGAFCVTKNCTECQFWVVCVRVRANERDREQALSQAVNAHTHRTHSLLLLFFSPFFLPPRFSLSSALERVRSICVMWQKTAQPRLGEREEWKQSKAYIQLGCLGVFTHTSQTIMSVCSHGDHL